MTTRLPHVSFGDLLNHQAAIARNAELEFWKGRFQSLSVELENLSLALRRGEIVEVYDRQGMMRVQRVDVPSPGSINTEKTDG